MIIKDGRGKVIGSIEFSDKELDLEKEKFEKLTELCNKVFDNEKIKKEENTKRTDKITTSISEALCGLANIIKDINKNEYQYYSVGCADDRYNNFDPIDPSPQETK